MSDQFILQQIQQMPPTIRQEVLDFMAFLMAKYKIEQKPVRKRPQFGSAKGRYEMSADFDAPLEIFKDYM